MNILLKIIILLKIYIEKLKKLLISKKFFLSFYIIKYETNFNNNKCYLYDYNYCL